MKVPQALIDELGYDLARPLWREWGRNDKERQKQYEKVLRHEAWRRKFQAELDRLKPKPVTKTARTKPPQRATRDFPYLSPSDIPQDIGRKATIIKNPEIVETKWGNRYRIALQFENGERRRWSMNNITFKNLLEVFGRNTSEWLGKEMYLKTEKFRIQGKDVTGIIGESAK